MIAASKINAGDFNRHVTVRRINENATPDAAGHIDETTESNWRDIGKRWVKLTPRGSREFFRGQEVAADITHQVDMRFDSISDKYKAKDQLVLGTRKINLAGPASNIDEQDILLRFPATEVAS
ncbi:MAG: hypothetical protein EXS05_22090 [Planctomycetaceae bacterium]|nr:hypothetical protein [Planctomycetaceae bacterium]